MMLKNLVVASMALFLLATVVAAQEKPDDALVLQGELAFRVYCASCHGKDAKGEGPLAEHLKVPPADLTMLSKNHGGEFPYDMVIETVNHGRSVRGHGTEEMPAWGDAFLMTEQTEAAARVKMDQLAHYLWSVQIE